MDNNILKKSSKKLIIFEIICVLIVIGIIGYTYSFFNVTATNSTVISGEAASVNLSITVTKVSPSNNKGLVPQLDEFITSAVTGRKGSCIDDNTNNVCQVYKITVKNNGASLYVNGKIEIDAKNNPNLKWAQISGTTSPTLSSDVHAYSYTKLIQNEYYNSSQSKDYYIVLWISETGSIQTDQGGFNGVVTVGDTTSVEFPSASSTLVKLNLTENTGTPDFSKTSCSEGCGETTVGLYKTEDDFGDSYYFRGDVENNYVYFAGFYWRIIRINGDGSVRMIYAGTSAHPNGYDDSNTNDMNVGQSAFNSSSNDNAYVGYMYGTTGSSTYSLTHSNTNDSTIKTAIDNWYNTNIKNTDYEQYVVDTIYCNDRELDSGTGIGTTTSYYKVRDRNVTKKSPTLKCNQVNDRFTVNSKVSGVTGNGALTNPVGLITIDETAYAGGTWNSGNSKYYLYTNDFFWTMSPFYFNGSSADGFHVSNTGKLSSIFVSGGYSARPVISISPDDLVGSGTMDDPFHIVTKSEKTLKQLNLTVSTGTPNFSKTSCSEGCGETTVGLYKTEDDFGDTYYFRGDVENNYVYFAGFYWRIIRINGDGSVRMIYAGTSAHPNGYDDSSTYDTRIGKSSFNSSSSDNAYVGYMYGTTGSSTYSLTHSNTNNSTIKTTIDNWYNTNIKNTEYEQYVVDTIYCNDRALQSGTGIGINETIYKAYERNYTNKTPSLKCNQENDRFTVNSKVSGITGNGALTDPIGLITIDEVAYAGGSRTTNSKYYLYTKYWYWTMSPTAFFGTVNDKRASEFNVSYTGDFYYEPVDDIISVRPVISISGSALTSGTGTMSAPFKIG